LASYLINLLSDIVPKDKLEHTNHWGWN